MMAYCYLVFTVGCFVFTLPQIIAPAYIPLDEEECDAACESNFKYCEFSTLELSDLFQYAFYSIWAMLSWVSAPSHNAPLPFRISGRTTSTGWLKGEFPKIL